MSRHRVEQEPGFVLHARAWSETSLIVEAFTQGHGRVGLVARGTRRNRGRLAPFQSLLLSWSGRGELHTLIEVDPDGPPSPALRGRALYSAFYLNELLMRLLPRNDMQADVFEDYRHALAGLVAGGDGPGDWVLRIFEKRLLVALGYAPPLDCAADTGAPVSGERHYRYVAQRGPVPIGGADEVAEVADADGDCDDPVVSGRTLLALAREESEEDMAAGGRERKEARMLMRALLAPHLGPRPLGSRMLFDRPGGAEVSAPPRNTAQASPEEPH